MLVQCAAGAWLSASVLDAARDEQSAARVLTAAGLAAAAAPAALAGAVDWSEQHEQQMRVGVVNAVGNAIAMGCYGCSLLTGSPWAGRLLRLGGLAALGVSGLLGGHISFRLAGGANHAEAVPHIVEPGWHNVMPAADLPDGRPVRKMLGETPIALVRSGSQLHALADRCSHMSGQLSESDLVDGCLTWILRRCSSPRIST